MLMIGFLFDFMAVNKRLTGKDLPSDSGAVERYAKALGLEAVVVDDNLFIGERLEAFDFAFGKYTTVAVEDLPEYAADLTQMREKFEATGIEPKSIPVIFTIDYISGY